MNEVSESLKKLIDEIEMIYIDEASVHSDLALRIKSLVPNEKIRFVNQEPFAESQGDLTASEFDRSKRHLFITPYRGQFFKRCPGATQKKALTCCNYHILNLGSQCNMNCSYCYLQSYLNSPVMKMYSNIDQALAELETMAQDHADHPFRVGTGEVIDSLSMDELSLFSRPLIEFFRKYPKWKLEFKTKSKNVSQFLDMQHAGNVIVSWSINPPAIIQSEEHGTASFEERLLAARACADKGFLVAFHIDPMIWTPQWKENYNFLAEEIHRRFKPEEVHIISAGALRFQPEQRHMMRERFGPQSLVVQAEMHPSEGGKLRYDTTIRGEMFQFLIKKFKDLDSRWNLFLCMETPETWIKATQKMPMQTPELKEIFKPLPSITKA